MNKPQLHLDFNSEAVGYSSGQTDMRISASSEGNVVGYVDYSVYRKEPHIKYIFVEPKWRRFGIATILMKRVQKAHPDHEVSLGMTTSDGGPFAKSLSRGFVKNSEFKAIYSQLKQLRTRRDQLQKQYDDFYDNPTEEKRKAVAALGDEFNDTDDEIKRLEKDARDFDIKPGKWLIDTGFKEWLSRVELRI